MDEKLTHKHIAQLHICLAELLYALDLTQKVDQ